MIKERTKAASDQVYLNIENTVDMLSSLHANKMAFDSVPTSQAVVWRALDRAVPYDGKYPLAKVSDF